MAITASLLSTFPAQQNTKALELALGRGTGAIYSSSRCVLPLLLLLLHTGSSLFSQELICTGGLYKQLFLAHFHTAGISRGTNVPVNTAAARRQQSWQQLRRLELGILGELGKDVPKIQLQKPAHAAGCRQRRAIISFHAILLLLKKSLKPILSVSLTINPGLSLSARVFWMISMGSSVSSFCFGKVQLL